MAVATKSAYEVTRQKRLEENKKRMEELDLNKLARSLHTLEPSTIKKVRPKVPKQPVDPASIRRSSRVADKPPVSYKDVPIKPLARPKARRRRDLSNRVYASDEDREYAIQRAEDLQSGLEQKFPSFVKPILQSHAPGGFWLGLPVHFCKKNLPKNDVTVNLVDENGDEFPTKYIALKAGLAEGWRGFSIDHKLVDGDALVFELIEPTTFKVYIIRVNENEEGDSES